LRGIRDDAPRERRTGRRKIPNQANGLSRVGRNHPIRTLTAPASLAADLRQSSLRKFSLRQSGDGDVAARGSAENATAMDFPQICHAAVRFDGEGWGISLTGKQPSSPASRQFGGFGDACAGNSEVDEQLLAEVLKIAEIVRGKVTALGPIPKSRK
jgi:hypothetical protein